WIRFRHGLAPPRAAVRGIRNFVYDSAEHLLALSGSRRGYLLEPKRKPVLLCFGAERPRPVELHGAPSGKILGRPLHLWRPKVFLPVARFAAADHPADSIQINLRCDVFKQWLTTKEPHGLRMHRDSAQVVDAPEGLVASDRSAEPNIGIALPPIGRQAFHDTVRALGEDQINAMRGVLDDLPSGGAPCQRRLTRSQVHPFVGHWPLVRPPIKEVAETIGKHPHKFIGVLQFPLPFVRLAPSLREVDVLPRVAVMLAGEFWNITMLAFGTALDAARPAIPCVVAPTDVVVAFHFQYHLFSLLESEGLPSSAPPRYIAAA